LGSKGSPKHRTRETSNPRREDKEIELGLAQKLSHLCRLKMFEKQKLVYGLSKKKTKKGRLQESEKPKSDKRILVVWWQ